MPKTKIYGAKGYFEWSPVINVSKAKFCPHFSGGTVDKNGVTPARYKSTNKVEQTIIETSDLYQKGYIETLCEYGEDDAAEETTSSPESAEGSAANAELQKMEFSCVGDAVEYLATTYGIAKYTLRSAAAVHEAGLAHGLDITINK
jgi:hypothetical protein